MEFSLDPEEWLATFADPVCAQSAIDRFTINAYDLVIDGEPNRPRLESPLRPLSRNGACGRHRGGLVLQCAGASAQHASSW